MVFCKFKEMAHIREVKDFLSLQDYSDFTKYRIVGYKSFQNVILL